MAKAENKKIHFHFLYKPFYFPNRTQLKSYLIKQLKKEGKTVETINYIFCSDSYLLKMNQQYLNHDTYTDIITFEHSQKGEALVSDIFISIDRVKENAHLFNTSFIKELHRVIFHGALHLAGYNDKKKEQSGKMRMMEEKYLQRYFVSRNTVS